MLSEGRPGVDDRYSLKDGKLVIETIHSWNSARVLANPHFRHTSSRARQRQI